MTTGKNNKEIKENTLKMSSFILKLYSRCNPFEHTWNEMDQKTSELEKSIHPQLEAPSAFIDPRNLVSFSGRSTIFNMQFSGEWGVDNDNKAQRPGVD